MKAANKSSKFDIQHAPFGYAYHKIITDADGKPVDYEFLEVNRMFENITGLHEKRIVGKTVKEVLPQITADTFDWISFYGDVALHGREGTVEQYSGTLDRWYKVKAYSPEKMHFATLFTDITGERILADSARFFLQDNQETIGYQKMCDDIRTISGAKYVSFNVFDENGRDFTTVAMAGMNQHLKAAAQQMGFEIVGKKWLHDPVRAEKIKGKNIVRFVHLHDLTGSVLPTMIVTSLERTFGIGEVYIVNIIKDGVMLGDFTVIMAAGKSLQNETAAELYAQQAGLVMQKFRLRDRLRAEEARIRAMTESAQDVIFMINPQGQITFCNPAAERVFGYTTNELLGQNLHGLLVPQRYHKIHNEAFSRFHETGQGAAIGKAVELEALHKDGHEFPVELSLSSFKLADGWYAVGIIRDISERKKAELELQNTNRELEEATALANSLAAQAEMASIAKSEFLANMSHEIRTPLNGIIGMTDLLLDTELTGDQRRFQEIVRSSGETLLTLINDILDFSKIEAKKLDLEIIDFDVTVLVEDFTDSMLPRAHEKGLELTCFIAQEVPAQLCGDPGRLRQILTNLTGNALKFTEKGEVAITVGVVDGPQKSYRAGDDTVVLRFSVRDTGIGIPAEKTGLLFNKFTQVDASTTRQYGGTGLGLAISKQLVELMGGEIGVSSAEGTGTEFYFTVGFQKQPRDYSIPVSRHVHLVNEHILVVDDHATCREIVARYIKESGMRHCGVGDAATALTKLGDAIDRADPFSIVIIDGQMPGMDGEELGRAIRADCRFAGIRLVLLTSMGTRGDGKRFTEAGFDAYLNKPVRRSELLGVLRLLPAVHDEGAVGEPRKMVTRHSVQEAMKSFHGTNAKVLLAEDNRTNQHVALAILKKLGVKADVAANGREALTALEHRDYDLVLMDVQMPEMNGIEAVHIIRDPLSAVRNHEVPVIAMTAHALKGDRENFLQSGMDGYVSKPVSVVALAKELAQWLPLQKRVSAAVHTLEVADQTGEHIWDRAGTMERLLQDTELVNDAAALFIDTAPQNIELLNSQVKNGDYPGIQKMAHTIKGGSATVGAEAIRKTATLIEEAAASQNREVCSMLVQRITGDFDDFRNLVLPLLEKK